MGYSTQDTISRDSYMRGRVAQCAAEQGAERPDFWAAEHARVWSSAPGWDDAWDSYLAANPDPEAPGYVPPGQHEGVITDSMVLAQVQAMLGKGKT